MTQDSPTPVSSTRWIPAGRIARGLTALVLVVVLVLAGIFALGGQRVELDGARPVLVDADAPDLPDDLTEGSTPVPTADALAPGDSPDDVALTVGDTDVPASQLQRSVRVLQGLYGIAVPTDADQAATFRSEVAKTVAVTTVLAEQAEDRDVTVPDGQVDAQLDNVVQQGFAGDRAAFVAQLEQAGLTEADVRREISSQLLALALFQQVTEGVTGPSAARIQTYYDSNRDDLVTPQRRLVSVVLQDSEAAADQVLQRLRDGEAVGEVARQVSTDEQTKADGGDLGSVTREQLPQAMSDEVFRTAPGWEYGPVQVEGGWAVGVVRRVVPSRALTLAESTRQIRATLLDRSREAAWARFLTQSVAAADVTYADGYRPADPDDIDLQPPGTAAGDPTEGATP